MTTHSKSLIFFIFSACLLAGVVQTELLFANKATDAGSIISASSEKYLTEGGSDDAITTTHRIVTVADGNDNSDLASGFYSNFLSQTFTKKMLDLKVSQAIGNEHLSLLPEKIGNMLFATIMDFNKKVDELITKNQAKIPPPKLKKASSISSGSGLAGITIVRSGSKSVLKAFQKGSSRVAIFRLRPAGNNGGYYYYKPIFFSPEYLGSPDFLTTDTEENKKNYNILVDEIETFEGDIVISGSDGLFDNLSIGMLTYVLNYNVAARQLDLPREVLFEELLGLEKYLRLDRKQGDSNWMRQTVKKQIEDKKIENAQNLMEFESTWSDYLWGPTSIFKKIFVCIWKGGKAKIVDILFNFKSLITVDMDNIDLSWFRSSAEAAVAITEGGPVGAVGTLLWSQRETFKQILVCIWDDNKEKLVEKMVRMVPGIKVDPKNVDLEWFEEQIKKIDASFEQKVSKKEKEFGPEGFDKKELAQVLFSEVFEKGKKAVIEKSKQKAIDVLDQAISKAKKGDFENPDIEIEIGKLAGEASKDSKNSMNLEDRPLHQLKRAIVRAERESLVFEGLRQKTSEPVSEWEVGAYRLFDQEIEFFSTSSADVQPEISSQKSQARLLSKKPYRMVGGFTGDETVLFEELEGTSVDPEPKNPKIEIDARAKSKPEVKSPPIFFPLYGVPLSYYEKRGKSSPFPVTFQQMQTIQNLKVVNPSFFEKPLVNPDQTKEEVVVAGQPANMSPKLQEENKQISNDFAKAKSYQELLDMRIRSARRIFIDDIKTLLVASPKKFGQDENILPVRIEQILATSFQFAIPELRYFAANFDSQKISNLVASVAKSISECPSCMTPLCGAKLLKDANAKCAGGKLDDISVVVSAVLNLKTPSLTYARELAKRIDKNISERESELEDNIVHFFTDELI